MKTAPDALSGAPRSKSVRAFFRIGIISQSALKTPNSKRQARLSGIFAFSCPDPYPPLFEGEGISAFRVDKGSCKDARIVLGEGEKQGDIEASRFLRIFLAFAGALFTIHLRKSAVKLRSSKEMRPRDE